MFRLSAQRTLRTASRVSFARTYATQSGPNVLVLLEHKNGSLDSASLSALTAAKSLGGQVTGLVVGGDEVSGIVEQAKK
jgi:electron transfer flavoprotein alpha subunit